MLPRHRRRYRGSGSVMRTSPFGAPPVRPYRGRSLRDVGRIAALSSPCASARSPARVCPSTPICACRWLIDRSGSPSAQASSRRCRLAVAHVEYAVLPDALHNRYHVEEIDVARRRRSVLSPLAAPVHAQAVERAFAPRLRRKRAPTSNSRTSRCSRRRLCATASTRLGNADGRSTANFSDSGLRRSARRSPPRRRTAPPRRIGDEAERHRLVEAGGRSAPCASD